MLSLWRQDAGLLRVGEARWSTYDLWMELHVQRGGLLGPCDCVICGPCDNTLCCPAEQDDLADLLAEYD